MTDVCLIKLLVDSVMIITNHMFVGLHRMGIRDGDWISLYPHKTDHLPVIKSRQNDRVIHGVLV